MRFRSSALGNPAQLPEMGLKVLAPTGLETWCECGGDLVVASTRVGSVTEEARQRELNGKPPASFRKLG